MTPEAGPAVHDCACHVCETGSDPELTQHHHQINLLLSRMAEPQRRWYVGTLATAPHASTITARARITGLDPKTIQLGCRELAADLADQPITRQRRLGGGRPRAEKKTQPS